MKHTLTLLKLAAVCFLSSAALAADDAVEQAVKRLAESGGYEWKSNLILPGGPKKAVAIEGRYNLTQGVHLKLTVEGQTVEVAARDNVLVASAGDEWKPAKKFTRSDKIHTALRGLIGFILPHHELESIVSNWRNVRKQDDGSYQGTADLSSARKLLEPLLKQGAQSFSAGNASLKASVWLEAGLPVKCQLEFSFSGSGLLRSQSTQLIVLTTLSNIGSTSVTMPPEAELALQAAKKP